MTYKVEFGEVRIGEIARQHIGECLDSNWLSSGKKVVEFEENFAKLFGYKYCVAVNSGTTADFLACLSLYDLGANRGDAIVVPALSFIALQNSVIAAGFRPVPVDIRRQTLNINEELIEKVIIESTVPVRAIIACNTMGKPCNMEAITKIAKKYCISVIVDNCEGHGCSYNNKLMSKWGLMSTYSGYTAHLIYAVQMGIVGTNSKKVRDSIVSTRSHGRKNGELFFNHERFGWNGQPTDLNASVGLESLETFNKTFNQRRYNLFYMLNKLQSSLNDVFWFNYESKNELHCPHALTLTFKEDNEKRFLRFYKSLYDAGIHCKLNFRSSFTQQKALSFLGYREGDFPEAEFVGRNGLHVPCHQYMSQEHLDYVISSIIRNCVN